MNYRRILLILAILLLLPFALKVRAQNQIVDGVVPDSLAGWDTTNWNDPTFIVYKVDTVGWEVGYRNVWTSQWSPDGGMSVICDTHPSLHVESYLKAITDTTIIGRFATDADATNINKWRVKYE